MAFNTAAWGVLASAPALRVFSYQVPTGDDATASGYFNSRWNDVQVNDLIYVEGTAAVTVYRVSAIAPNSVTIAAV